MTIPFSMHNYNFFAIIGVEKEKKRIFAASIQNVMDVAFILDNRSWIIEPMLPKSITRHL